MWLSTKLDGLPFLFAPLLLEPITGSSSDGTSTAHHGRPLLMPDEIRRADNDEVFVLQQGQPPYSLTRLDYRTDSEFAGMADENPMYAAVSETADSD